MYLTIEQGLLKHTLEGTWCWVGRGGRVRLWSLFNVLHAVFGGSLQNFSCASKPCIGVDKLEFRRCGIVGDWSNFECIHILLETGLAMWSRLAPHPQSSCHSFPSECWNYRAVSPHQALSFILIYSSTNWDVLRNKAYFLFINIYHNGSNKKSFVQLDI